MFSFFVSATAPPARENDITTVVTPFRHRFGESAKFLAAPPVISDWLPD
jgi:hypothetical protein